MTVTRAAQTGRADAQGVAALLYLVLELGQARFRVGGAHFAQQGVLGHVGGLLEGAPETDPDDYRWARVGSGLAHRVHDEVYSSLATLRRLEHPDGAHVLRAAALGSDDDPHLVSGNDPRVQHGRSVVGGVLASPDGIGHGRLAQVTLGVALAHTLVHCFLEASAHEVDVLAHLQEDDGQAGVLA